MKNKILIIIFFLITLNLFAKVDMRVILVSNENLDGSSGRLILKLQAMSDAGNVSIAQFRCTFDVGTGLKGLNPSATFSNQLFSSSDNNVFAESYISGTGPHADEIKGHYQLTGTPSVITTSWTDIYTISILYDLSEGGTTDFDWVSGDFIVNDLAFQSLQGTLGVLPSPVSLNPSPLPVELTLFSANPIESGVNLTWETATEINNYGFEILRSNQRDSNSEEGTNEESWKIIGFVGGHGNSNSPKLYSFADNSISASGKYNYRLKQIDIDGNYEYSKIVEIEIGIPTNFEVVQNYPNPFNPSTTITFSLPEKSEVNVQIFNMLGQSVYTVVKENLNAGKYSYNFDASNLSSGNYFYRVIAGKNSATKKMILVK